MLENTAISVICYSNYSFFKMHTWCSTRKCRVPISRHRPLWCLYLQEEKAPQCQVLPPFTDNGWQKRSGEYFFHTENIQDVLGLFYLFGEEISINKPLPISQRTFMSVVTCPVLQTEVDLWWAVTPWHSALCSTRASEISSLQQLALQMISNARDITRVSPFGTEILFQRH